METMGLPIQVRFAMIPLFLIVCTVAGGCGEKHVAPRAEKGIIDLAGWDFNQKTLPLPDLRNKRWYWPSAPVGAGKGMDFVHDDPRQITEQFGMVEAVGLIVE